MPFYHLRLFNFSFSVSTLCLNIKMLYSYSISKISVYFIYLALRYITAFFEAPIFQVFELLRTLRKHDNNL
jgi:hypothetical protein